MRENLLLPNIVAGILIIARDGYIWYNQVMILKKNALLAILITFFLIIIFLFFNNDIFASNVTTYSSNFTFEKFYNIKNGTSPGSSTSTIG